MAKKGLFERGEVRRQERLAETERKHEDAANRPAKGIFRGGSESQPKSK